MDEQVTPVQVAMPGTEIAATATAVAVLSSQQTAVHAVALGWALAELLGRCFALAPAQTAENKWDGDKLISLQEVYTPREKIRALMVHIRFLADALGINSCLIDHENDPDIGRPYLDVIEEDVKQLTRHDNDAMTIEQLRGKVNERLFFWDLRVHAMLQDRATAVPKVYIVGRSLAGLRWYFGLQDKLPDNEFMKKICDEYIPLMNPYVSPFTTGALSNSLRPWWDAISSGQLQPGPNADAPIELHKQADIWYSLMACERDALSYAPVVTGRSYIWKVLRVSWPMFLLGALAFIVILGLLLLVIISNPDVITKDIAAIAALLTTLGILNSLGKTVSNLLENAVSKVTGNFRGTVIENIRHSTQQDAVNKATFIPPASASPKVEQSTQVKG